MVLKNVLGMHYSTLELSRPIQEWGKYIDKGREFSWGFADRLFSRKNEANPLSFLEKCPTRPVWYKKISKNTVNDLLNVHKWMENIYFY